MFAYPIRCSPANRREVDYRLHPITAYAAPPPAAGNNAHESRGRPRSGAGAIHWLCRPWRSSGQAGWLARSAQRDKNVPSRHSGPLDHRDEEPSICRDVVLMRCTENEEGVRIVLSLRSANGEEPLGAD